MFSDATIILTLILSAISVALCVAEYLIGKARAIFLLLDAVFVTAASLAIIYKGGALCDALLLVCITLVCRLFFEIKMGRKDK